MSWLETHLEQLFGGGPTTLEATFTALVRLDPPLAARGMPWLAGQLHSSPRVRTLPDNRFVLRGNDDPDVEGPGSDPLTNTKPLGSAYVVFDLETNSDRAAVVDHEIIEIGACHVEDGVCVDTFQLLVRPTRPLIEKVTELTGLTDADLQAASPLPSALADFLRFCDGQPLAAHNGFSYDFPILDTALASSGLPPFPGERLDSFELAHLAAPRAGHGVLPNADGSSIPTGRSLDALVQWAGADLDRDSHRALRDSELTAAVILHLLGELETEDPDRVLQRWLLHQGDHPWAAWLTSPKEPPSLDACVRGPSPSTATAPSTNEFRVSEVIAPLAEGGALVTSPGRRHRPQQEEMADLVAGALGRRERWMIEAPTGTGKTLAYLVPAIGWARAARVPVVIATHSKVLQDQIIDTIHELSATLGPVDWVLLKGQENYVSLDALEGALESEPTDALEALALAVIVGWVAKTQTGDWDDLRAWALEAGLPGFPALRWRLSIDSSPGVAFTRLDELCFYRRALEGLATAEIAVLNHAVLVSRGDVADEVEFVIIDEAHNLEEAATGALTEETSGDELHRLLRTVYDRERRTGTIARYVRATSTSLRADEIIRVRTAIDQCAAAAAELGPLVVDYVRSRTPVHVEEVEKYGASYRVRPGFDTDGTAFAAVRRSSGQICAALFELANALGDLVVPEQLARRYSRRRLEAEIARMGRTARHAATTLASVIGANEDDLWANLLDLGRADGEWTWTMRRVPIDVSPQLSEVWDSMDGVVLTSATLQVAGSMTHLIRRLGLRHAEPRALGTPFDNLSAQQLLVLPDHLPTPRGGLMDEFTFAEADELARLFTLTSGGAMALFTARARMTHARDHVRPLLEERQIPVFCQGDEPSPALIDRMRSDRRTSLLATRSFWEGVDIPGEFLSLLVIEKLPFASPGDPIVAARMDRVEANGLDPFADYLVPAAALRFVQGVGRLIRTEDDIGVCVVLDKRLRKPVAYRETFLSSLPGPPQIARPLSAAEGYRSIAEHLDVDLTDDLLERLLAMPSADPWGDIEQLQLSDDESRNQTLVDDRLEEVRSRLGFQTWRPGQLEIMRRFVTGDDVLGILPTGTGKSLCYQLPALLRPGLTVVIAPLIALMRDQVEGMREKGMTKIAAVYSGQAQSEQEEILARARGGAYKLLYVSPERLWSQRFRHALADVDIARIVVDEAHCISQWGHTFRPEYSAIPTAVREISADGRRPTMLAATATATPAVQAEIVDGLEMHLPAGPVAASPDRPELRYYVVDSADKNDREVQMMRVLDGFRGQSAIVYVPSRAKATQLAALLRADSHVARGYHGGMESSQRLFVEEAFRYGEIDVVVATKAFGLGIDKPDIALIVHLEMPGSIEEYIQETGRAARGAGEGVGPKTGACVLLRMPRDCGVHRMFAANAAPELDVIKKLWAVLQDSDQYVTFDNLARSVGLHDKDREQVSLAIHYLVQDGSIARHEDVTWMGRVWVPGDANELYRQARDTGTHFPPHTRAVLRSCIDRGSSDFHLMTWAERFDIEPAVLERSLLELHRRDILSFTGWEMALHLEAKDGARPDFAEMQAMGERRKGAVKALSAAARNYTRSDGDCRRRRLLQYLGASAADRCDGCDVCRPDLPRPWSDSTITQGQIGSATSARLAVLALLDDVSGADYSRRNLTKCLGGMTGRFDLPDRLAEHALFGSLASMRYEGIESTIDELINEGVVAEGEVEAEGRRWKTVRVVDQTREDS